ncbi:ABC transporter permease [uncultured Cohaesibacter sp.]|uniref:ABC transporter permease n=1 Tax=uncultured Cohaesibacter sp. TaxID=1002546 RepID=UPI002AA8394F|nr:ABC transporter permease [uncultured Cohaesibacter sp.]
MHSTSPLKIQFRVIAAMVLREVHVRYGYSSIGYIWALLEPMVMIAAFSGVILLLGKKAIFGNNASLFVALGILPFFMFRQTANQLLSAFKANQALLNYPIVKQIDTLIARYILEVLTMILVSIIVISIFLFGFGEARPRSILDMLIALVGLSLVAFGIGTINAVIGEFISSWNKIYSMITRPLIWISGIFYSLESIPRNILNFLVWNPIIHGVEGFRAGYYQNYRVLYLDLIYLYEVGIVLVCIGLVLERAIRLKST